MKLEATRKEFVLRDESGYSFQVTLIRDDEFGWNAHVSFSAHGLANEHGAVAALRRSVAEFMRMSAEVEP